MFAHHLFLYKCILGDLSCYLSLHKDLIDLTLACQKLHIHSGFLALHLQDLLFSTVTSTPSASTTTIIAPTRLETTTDLTDQYRVNLVHHFFTTTHTDIAYPSFVLDLTHYSLFLLHTASQELKDKVSAFKPHLQQELRLVVTIIDRLYEWSLLDHLSREERLIPIAECIRMSPGMSPEHLRQRLAMYSE